MNNTSDKITLKDIEESLIHIRDAIYRYHNNKNIFLPVVNLLRERMLQNIYNSDIDIRILKRICKILTIKEDCCTCKVCFLPRIESAIIFVKSENARLKGDKR